MESVLREGQNGAQRRERARGWELPLSALPRAQGTVLTVSREVAPLGGCLVGWGWTCQINNSKEFKYQTSALSLAAETLVFLTPGKEPPAEAEDQVCGSKGSHSLNQERSPSDTEGSTSM